MSSLEALMAWDRLGDVVVWFDRFGELFQRRHRWSRLVNLVLDGEAELALGLVEEFR